MTILEIIQTDILSLQCITKTNGGEWAGPCPFCGGKDRFRVWPGKDKAWCRTELGIEPMNQTKFGKEIKARFDSYADRHTYYKGIGLKQK